MSLEIHILSGSRRGQRETFNKSVVAIGRHPLSDLRFDPEQDRDVSSKHAEVRTVAGRCVVVDMNSTNGTFVNGERIVGERELRQGDVVSFGKDGPQAEIRLAGTSARVSAGAIPATAVGRASIGERAGVSRSHPSPPAGSTTERIAIAVTQQTRQIKRMLVAAIVLLLVGVGAIVLIGQSGDRKAREHMLALEQRNDSLERAFKSGMTEVNKSMSSALEDARQEASRLRAQLRTGSPADVEALSRQLSSLEQKRQVMLSSGKDFSYVDSLNRRAVVMLAVEKADGSLEGGSGFAVTADGYVVTNRHVVLDKSGAKPRRIGVIFNDTREWLPATVVKWSEGADLALIKIEGPGAFPTVAGVSRSSNSVRVGSPVAIIGYPLSLDTPMEGEGMNVKAASTLGPGTVSKLLEEVVQVDAFAGSGSSGSPLFDARGNVVGIIWGGNPESGGRIVYAVPSAKLIALLPASAQGIVK